MRAVFWCLKGLSAAVFLLGVLALLVSFIGIWLFVGTHAVMTHWLIGLAYMIATFGLAPRAEPFIRVPFQIWWELWTWADALILEREREMKSEMR